MRMINTVTGLSLCLIFLGCRGGANPLPTQGFVEISFPLNKKCIYASSFIVQKADSNYFDGLHIFSLEFTRKTETADQIRYTGQVTSYVPPALAGENRSKLILAESGEILVTIKNNWVLYQFSDVYEAFNMFIKTGTDTMDLPNQFENQFPSFPQIIFPFTQYSAFRPANSGADWGYTGVYREFKADDFTTWSTPYSQYRGISISGKHELLNFSLELDMIVDEAGIVISQISFGESILANEQGIPIDTVYTYLVNQRLVNYTDPNLINPLSYYADQILEDEITLLSVF